MFDQLINVLGRGQVCQNPVFIIGSPRSGTTVLANSLARHSGPWTSNESDFLFHLFSGRRVEEAYTEARQARGNRWLEKEGVERDEFFAYVGLGLNALFTSRSQGRRWVEQTPLYTLIADTLAELFPGSALYSLAPRRRRVVNSMFNFLRADGVQRSKIEAAAIGSWTTDFREACRVWRQYTDLALDFCARRSQRAMTVRNEDLILDPCAGFAMIQSFLDLSHEDALADFFRTHRMNSSFQVDTVGALSLQSFPNPWDAWTREQRMTFIGEAGPTLLSCGMATCDDLCLAGSYERLCQRIADLVRTTLPCGCAVAVISKGDDQLLDLGFARAIHFPQDESGSYAGHHPATSAEAIEKLQTLTARGVDFLLVPETLFWWLEYYGEFREHLDTRYRRLLEERICAIWDLRGDRAAPGITPE